MSNVREPVLRALASQLISSHRRLAKRSGGKTPMMHDMLLALRFFLKQCDENRATATASCKHSQEPDEAFATNEEKVRLRLMVNLCDLAYKNRATLDTAANQEPKFRVVCSRHTSMRYKPAYYLAHFEDTRELVFVVRGTCSPGDVLTDASLETDEFLGSFGHRGVVQSARWILSKMLPTLKVIAAAGEVDNIILTGHSLGASVAAAVTLILRSMKANEVPKILRNITCLAICPPPFLSEQLAASSLEMGIISVVNGLDCIPRMSVASLDRFFLSLARFDYGLNFRIGAARVAGSLLKPERALSLETAFVNAFAPFNPTLDKNHPETLRDSRIDSALARLGITVDHEDPPELHLPGKIVHIDIPFVRPNHHLHDTFLQRSRFKVVTLNAFRDIDASIHMIGHHMLYSLREQLDIMLGDESKTKLQA